MAGNVEIRSGSTCATIAPERGGMAATFEAFGERIFYLDEATLRDRTKNVRGGAPVLFPSPGKLAGDAWARGKLEQHGFARKVAWDVVLRSDDRVTVGLTMDAGRWAELAPSGVTEASYPWPCRVEIEYRVEPGVLHAVARVACEAGARGPMPYGLGYHPYFQLDDPRTFAVETAATRAFDNVTKKDVAFDARTLALGTTEVDLHLRDHAGPGISFALERVRVAIECDPAFGRWVLWSVPGKPFVCVEPWTSPGDALNTGEGLSTLEPGASRTLALAYRVEKR